MAASKCNYVVVYENHPQVYSASTKDTALKSALPKGIKDIASRRVLYITMEPDTSVLAVYPLDQQEIIDAYNQMIEEKQETELKKQTEPNQDND